MDQGASALFMMTPVLGTRYETTYDTAGRNREQRG